MPRPQPIRSIAFGKTTNPRFPTVMKFFTTFSIALLLCGVSAPAAVFYSTMEPTGIPDGNPGGLTTTIDVSGLYSQTTDVNVNLDVSGGPSGDWYAYLSYGDATAVLLNRPGKTSSDALGYDDTAFVIKLNDQASQTVDIHLYRTVTGYSILGGAEWRPDARNVNPQTVLDTDDRTAPLSSFNSLNPNGTWTLFFADMAGGGGQATLNGWSLEIEAVPEPINQALAAFGVAAGAVLAWRRIRRSPTRSTENR